MTPVQVLVGCAAAFALWKWRKLVGGDGRVVLSNLISKDGICYEVRLYESGKSTSTRVDSSRCG